MVARHTSSVEILEKLSNEDYDELLSKNIVFLNLVDCSAINTVLECLVRNTPVIVNRLPALEEILGKAYPGFYTSLAEAAQMCQDITRIQQVYVYISKLDKTRYTLEFFLNQIQNIILNNDDSYSYDLFHKEYLTKNIFQSRYTRLLKYLPYNFATYLEVL